MVKNLQKKKKMGMRDKLIALFVVIKVIPLVILAVIAWYQTLDLNKSAREALLATKELTIENTTQALQTLSQQNIERLTTDTAKDVADFLYNIDSEIRTVSKFEPSDEVYKLFIETQTRRVIEQSEWVIDADNPDPHTVWEIKSPPEQNPMRTSKNPENDLAFSYRPADTFKYTEIPLFREVTFIDLNGQEVIKVTTDNLMDKELKDVSQKENTFIKAETYWPKLQNLKDGEIYVSDVIGAYTPSRVIGVFNKANAEKFKVEFKPEEHAFSGFENPVGKKFKGIVRWATPVYKNDIKIGYVTLALNHDHLIDMMAMITPMIERYNELSNAYTGNYAFIWDYLGRSIVHPRHHSMAGYNPETGEPQAPWLEQSIYDRWIESGKDYIDFITEEPTFFEQSTKKKGSKEQIAAGNLGLDCRYLNHAPQCTGWFDLAGDGGSGSFVILWSGLTKLTTAAAIPYYTGQYADRKVGFGFVAIGAGLDDFTAPATKTGELIEDIIQNSENNMRSILTETAYSLSISTILMTVLVIFIAIWLASNMTKRITIINNGMKLFREGNRHFRFDQPAQDEIGVLCESFDIMADSIEKNLQGLIVIVDNNDNIIYANDDTLAYFDKDFKEIEGKNYLDISLFNIDENPLTLYRQNKPINVLRNNFNNKYYKGNVEPFIGDNDNQIGFTISIQDITEIIKSQQEIALQRLLLLTVFSSSPDLIWYKNSNDQYIAVNPRFCSITNKLEEEIINQHSFDVLPSKIVFNDVNYDTKAKEKKGSVYSEEDFVFHDGHQETLEVVRTPVYSKEGNFEGIVGVARDISARVKVERKLRETQTGLEKAIYEANEANSAKSAFLARMSHEIRTPMNAILGMSTIAKDKMQDKNITVNDLSEQINQIETSTNHLLSLVNEILETSKLDITEIKLKKEVFDMTALLKDVTKLVKDFSSSNNINLNINLPSNDEQNYLSDPMRIRQVLITLINNSVKQATNDNKTPIVDVNISQEQVGKNETRFKFVIKDNGNKMDSNMVKSIENPLKVDEALQNSKILDENYALSLCQHIVQHLGGKIRLQTSDAYGSELSFTIRLEQVIPVKEEKIQEKNIDLSILAGKRALIVDDVQINRVILKSLLAGVKAISEEADDGTTCIDMFQNSEIGYYDIILMDIQMPKMNGFEATEYIRKLDRADATKIPILAVTANSFKEDIDKSLESGMDAHFAKPVNRDNLFETMSKIFHKMNS